VLEPAAPPRLEQDRPAAGRARSPKLGQRLDEVRISAAPAKASKRSSRKIDAMIASPFATVEALVPYDHYELVSQAYEHGSVKARRTRTSA